MKRARDYFSGPPNGIAMDDDFFPGDEEGMPWSGGTTS